MDEAATRRNLIDKQLEAAGWNISDINQVIAEPEYKINLPNGRHEYVDYCLVLKGKIAAVIEAKKTSRSAEVGREQARQYAQNIKKYMQPEEQIPFIFYANGDEIWFWDEENNYPPRKVYGFPTKDDLEYFQFQRKRLPLDSIDVNVDISGRDYQIEAIRNITENFANSQREALLVMATGTGKTRTAVSLVDVLMKARWAKRILFLADRKALRDQALGAFKEHLNEPSVWPKPGEYKFAHDRRIYVQTYQSMLKYATGDNQISPHFFDLIIADEAVSALDVSVQAQVLNLMMELQVDLGLSFLFISHDMAVVERVSHDVGVMYLGRLVEIGPRPSIFRSPQHPYTQDLLKAVPIADPDRRKLERDLNFKPLPSPIHNLNYRSEPSVYRKVAKDHYVLTTDCGY